MIQTATVIGNNRLCREHYRLTVNVRALPAAHPGQIEHISPNTPQAVGYRVLNADARVAHSAWVAEARAPMLRRAFSIAGLR